VIVATAIYGGYDTLAPHPDHDEVDRWVCFTDDPDLALDDGHGWEIRVEPSRFEHPRLAAKWWKCHPPTGSSARSLWVDASIVFTDALVEEILVNLDRGAELVLFRHPDRTSIVDEAAVSAGMAKYQGLPVEAQARHYLDAWGHADRRLWAAGVIGRHHTSAVLQMGAAWFAECEHWTYQDQISLPPLIDRYRIDVATIHQHLWSSPWLSVRPHAHLR
jgi:hypothetical protein